MSTQNVQVKQENDVYFYTEQDNSYGDNLEIKKAEVDDKIIKEEDNSITIKEEETSSDYEMNFLFQETKANVSIVILKWYLYASK